MKTTYTIEIPVEIEYDIQPAEQQSHDYPGNPAYIDWDIVEIPTQAEIRKAVEDAGDAVEQMIWEEVKADSEGREEAMIEARAMRLEDIRYEANEMLAAMKDNGVWRED